MWQAQPALHTGIGEREHAVGLAVVEHAADAINSHCSMLSNPRIVEILTR